MGNSGRDETLSWRTCLRVLACVLVGFLAIHYWGAVENALGLLFTGGASIFIGMAIAYVVNIPMRFFERHLRRKDGTPLSGPSMALALLVTAGLLVLVLAVVIPHLVACVITLAEKAPQIIDSILSNNVVAALVPASLKIELETIDWASLVSEVAAWLQSGIIHSMPQIASFVSQVTAVFMGFVFAMLFLGEKRSLAAQIHRLVSVYLGQEADARFSRGIALLDECFGRYIVGQFVAASIMGLLTLAVMLVFQLPYAPTISALVCVLTIVPIVGPLIAMILGALLILPVSWEQALIFLVINFILQQVQNNLVSPRIINRYVKLDGLWTLIGITLGCAFGGILGAFAGVPCLAAIKRIVSESLARHEEQGASSEGGPVLKAAVKTALEKMDAEPLES